MIGRLKAVCRRPGNRPDPIGAQVGSRIRICRINKGLSLLQLAQALGVTAQEVQQYEQGKRAIRASCLIGLSQTLGVPISDFFDGQANAVELSPDRHQADRWEILEIAMAFCSITNPVIRDRVIKNIQTMISNNRESQSSSGQV